VRRLARRRNLDIGEVEPGRQHSIAHQRIERLDNAAAHQRVDVQRQFRHRRSWPGGLLQDAPG